MAGVDPIIDTETEIVPAQSSFEMQATVEEIDGLLTVPGTVRDVRVGMTRTLRRSQQVQSFLDRLDWEDDDDSSPQEREEIPVWFERREDAIRDAERLVSGPEG